MSKAILSIETPGVMALGLDLVWDNEEFEFKSITSLGVFDEVQGVVAEKDTTRLILAAQNITERNVVSVRGMDIAELEFEWGDGAAGAAEVEFLAQNVSAHNSDGVVVPVQIEIENYKATGDTIVRLVWE